MLLATNQSPQEVADALGLSLKTIQNHTANAYGKLGAHSLRDVMRMIERE